MKNTALKAPRTCPSGTGWLRAQYSAASEECKATGSGLFEYAAEERS